MSNTIEKHGDWYTMEAEKPNGGIILVGWRAKDPRELNEAVRYLKAVYMAYPGYAWACEMDDGMLTIRNLSLSASWGCRMLPTATTDPERSAVMYAGEILERFALARDAAGSEAELVGKPTNKRGELEPEK